MIDEIKNNLSNNILCNHLEIIDESPNHGGYSGTVSHVKIIVVSDDFEGLSLIKRHQLVYKALDNLVKGASGQAIQNMNLVYKFPEHLGLK